MKLKLATITLAIIAMAECLPAFAQSIEEGRFVFNRRLPVYYSNGQGHYCRHIDWADCVKLSGDGCKLRTQRGALKQYSMVYDGMCGRPGEAGAGTSVSPNGPGLNQVQIDAWEQARRAGVNGTGAEMGYKNLWIH